MNCASYILVYSVKQDHIFLTWFATVAVLRSEGHTGGHFPRHYGDLLRPRENEVGGQRKSQSDLEVAREKNNWKKINCVCFDFFSPTAPRHYSPNLEILLENFFNKNLRYFRKSIKKKISKGYFEGSLKDRYAFRDVNNNGILYFVLLRTHPRCSTSNNTSFLCEAFFATAWHTYKFGTLRT